MKVKAGDTVKITAGKDRGREGVVQKVFPKQQKVIVEGMMLFKKHMKAQGQGKPGGIIDIQKPISISNLAVICPTCKQETRVGYLNDNQGGKTRICKKCKKELKGKK
jgi:large subunit ribosomal protein L24